MKNRIRTFFETGYPVSFKSNWRIAIYAGMFISFFMAFFEPFGLTNLDIPHKRLILAGYGMVTSIVLMIDIVFLPFYLRNIFNEDRWTNGKQIILFCWIFFSIGLGNYVYSSYIFNFELINIKIFLVFELFTLGVGIIPSLIILLWSNNVYLKRNLKSARELTGNLTNNDTTDNQQQMLNSFSSYNGKDSIKILDNDIIFIESEGNYCSIYYLANSEFKKKVLRTTLKNIEECISEESLLFKSHRAFIINPIQIKMINGNAQGYRLIFNHTTKEASVSRQYIKEFKSLIQGVN